MTNHLDVSTFQYDDSLGRRLNAFVVVKGFNQLAIVAKIIRRKGNKSYGLTSVDRVSQRRYSDGHIAFTSLDTDEFGEDTLELALDSTEPFEIDLHDGQLIHTAGPGFVRYDLDEDEREAFEQPWMSYLHTIEFSEDGERILTASTGLDTILEIELATGKILWQWNAWDHGFNYVKANKSYVSRDPAQAAALQAEHPDAKVRLIEDPLSLPREGLATNRTPMNLNGVHYGRDGAIIATGFHRSEAFVVQRDGSFEQRELGLSHPHSLRLLGGGYQVASTGQGRLLLLDADFQPHTIVDLANLLADPEKRAGFGEWLQTASLLDEERMLFAAVDALRDGVHILDLKRQRRRFISNPPEWTIQAVIDAPIEEDEFPAERQEAEESEPAC
jgi:hypothetical protein